jgi:two-component system, NarL family, nitrate/nitrite response regulator NarL
MNLEPTIVIGDGRLFREGLQMLLAGTAYDVVASGGKITTLKFAGDKEVAPRLVILIPSQQNPSDTNELKEARRRYPDSRIVMLATQPSQHHFTTCLSAGVDGYLFTDISRDVLMESLRLLFLGEKVFPTILAAWIVDDTRRAPEPQGANVTSRRLTPREIEILRHIASGEANKAIGARLGISDATVKLHLRKLLRKLGAANRTQAAIWAMNNGFGPTTGNLAAGADQGQKPMVKAAPALDSAW